MVDYLTALPWVVVYRRIDEGVVWHPMAAFDSENIANKYCAECAKPGRPWEYKVIENKE